MRQEKGLQTVVIAVLAVAILVMSVGFAYFSQDLHINGTATFTAAKWDVHFDTTSFAEDSTITASPTPTVTGTNITYTVTLAKPGDEYKFHVNVVNEGTIDAILKKITITNSSNAEYVEHIVKYNTTSYTSTTDNINATLVKKTGNTPGTVPVEVTVRYKEPANASSLPSTDQTVTLNVTLDYQSA